MAGGGSPPLRDEEHCRITDALNGGYDGITLMGCKHGEECFPRLGPPPQEILMLIRVGKREGLLKANGNVSLIGLGLM